MVLIDRRYFPLQDNRQIKVLDTSKKNTAQTAYVYHYNLSAEVLGTGKVITMRQYKDAKPEEHKDLDSLCKKLQSGTVPVKLDPEPAAQTPIGKSQGGQSPNTPAPEDEPGSVPPLLMVIDSRQCSSRGCEKFVKAMEKGNSWGRDIRKQITGLIPNGNIHQILIDVGIFLPDVGDVGGSAKLSPVLVFSLAMPYFGIRKAMDSSSMGHVAPDPESLSLSEYGSRGRTVQSTHSGNEIWVHRVWFMIFSNDMIAMFRSKEDNHSDLPHPLYGCQERVCMFRVLVHIISNILELSQRRCLIFLKQEVHDNDSKIYEYITKISTDRGEKSEETGPTTNTRKRGGDIEGVGLTTYTSGLEKMKLTTNAWKLERDIKNSRGVVQSQIDILGDIQKFYGNIHSSLDPTKEQIIPTLMIIEGIVKGLVEFSQRIDYLLETVRRSKRDLSKALAEASTRDAAQSTMQASKDTINAIEGQRQVMSMLTILTTVFLPLGFFTSFYGMAGDDWKSNNSQEFLWPGRVVGGVSIGITVLITLITLGVVLKSRDYKRDDWWRFWIRTPKPQVGQLEDSFSRQRPSG